MVGKNVFFLSGSDIGSKKGDLEKIRSPLLKEFPGIQVFSFFPDIDESLIQKEIENFSFSKRIFIIRNPQDLSPQTKAYLSQVITRSEQNDYFIFDSDLGWQELQKDPFFVSLAKLSPVINPRWEKRKYPFGDLEEALRSRSGNKALLVLKDIFEDNKKAGNKQKDISSKVLPLYVLGLIVKVFGKKPAYLKYIFDTDRLIKEDLVNPRVALEILILRLTSS
jgi:hypothetical protein